jgi:hypothetical protein
MRFEATTTDGRGESQCHWSLPMDMIADAISADWSFTNIN